MPEPNCAVTLLCALSRLTRNFFVLLTLLLCAAFGSAAELRGRVLSASAEGRVLVVPVLVSVGNIQKQIRERLAGLDYTMAEFGIASQPEAEKWIRAQALAAE